MHKFSLVDGIRAFSNVALEVKEGVEWGGLKKAKRHPVILIVDEVSDVTLMFFARFKSKCDYRCKISST